MNASSKRAVLWLAQAKNDLLFAKSAAREGFYSQCCFICQQAAEKALKAILFSRGTQAVFTHSLLELCARLKINGTLKTAAGTLDQYYISGRYPDALPGSAPFQAFSEKQAREAVRFASLFVKKSAALTKAS